MNRLAAATSPYLLQHKDNPVDWWEWGPEAFAAARRLSRPVLLSVGYAACHWCHVMAHESFEDEATAAQLNAAFVPVKVDREERPDVDAVYMDATVALTGQGGWPMTAFLTPEGKVFHAGTYYPPTPHPHLPSFRQLLAAVSDAWQHRRSEVDGASARLSAILGRQRGADAAGRTPPSAADLERAVRRLRLDYDEQRGGFGGAPKFPPSMVLEWLLRHAARVGTDDPSGSGCLALDMASNTLRQMARSGMYDQVDGGFARYAVDADWVVPHFEKMLYDNAQLARVYLHWWRLTGDPLGRRIALETCDWMLAALRTSQGGLSSALDADTAVAGEAHGVEGLTYVWTPAELAEVLGEQEGAWFAEVSGVSAQGTFEHGTSTLRLLREVDGPDADPQDARRWQVARERLRPLRSARPQPSRDDKVVAAWNALAISALAEVGTLLERPDLVDAARAAAGLLLDLHRADGRLRRVSRDGQVGTPEGQLEDHANLADALLTLYSCTGQRRWVTAAEDLVGTMVERFWSGTSSDLGFSDTPLDAPDPLLQQAAGRRPGDPADNAYPSGTSAAAHALIAWSALSGDHGAREVAHAALDQTRRVAGGSPRFAGWGLAAAEAAVDGPAQVAVVGADGDSRTAVLWRTALRGTAPGLVVARGPGHSVHPGHPDDAPPVALLAGRGLVQGAPAAYPCRAMVCDLPTADPRRLARFVGAQMGLE